MARKKTAARKVSSEMMLNTSACRMNGMSRRMRKNSMSVLSLFVVGRRRRLAMLAPGFQTWPIETSLRRFWRPYQKLTRPRENITAENIEVMMPRQWTIAKARIGPEPKASSARPAISVVTFESRMVAKARS